MFFFLPQLRQFFFPVVLNSEFSLKDNFVSADSFLAFRSGFPVPAFHFFSAGFPLSAVSFLSLSLPVLVVVAGKSPDHPIALEGKQVINHAVHEVAVVTNDQDTARELQQEFFERSQVCRSRSLVVHRAPGNWDSGTTGSAGAVFFFRHR